MTVTLHAMKECTAIASCFCSCQLIGLCSRLIFIVLCMAAPSITYFSLAAAGFCIFVFHSGCLLGVLNETHPALFPPPDKLTRVSCCLSTYIIGHCIDKNVLQNYVVESNFHLYCYSCIFFLNNTLVHQTKPKHTHHTHTHTHTHRAFPSPLLLHHFLSRQSIVFLTKQ